MGVTYSVLSIFLGFETFLIKKCRQPKQIFSKSRWVLGVSWLQAPTMFAFPTGHLASWAAGGNGPGQAHTLPLLREGTGRKHGNPHFTKARTEARAG